MSTLLFKDWLMVMDTMFFWRTYFSNAEFEKLKEVPIVELHVPANFCLQLDAKEDDLKCDIRIIREYVDKHIAFHLPPPGSCRLVVIEMRPMSDSIAEWVLRGNTYPFRSSLDKMDIPWQYDP